MSIQIKVSMFFKSIWNGILGIVSEISLALFFIAAGIMVCLLWWSFFR